MRTTSLSESEARHRAIVESALDCVITIDDEGRVLEFNPAAEQTFGYAREQAVGAPIAELIVPARLRAAHREGFARCVATGDGDLLGRRVEMPGLRADGTEILVELAVTRVELPGRPLFTAYLRDISAARRAEEELRRSQELYRLVVLGSKDLIALVGTDGRIVFASPSHESKLGYPPELLGGAALATYVHPDDAASLGEAWALALAGERGSFVDVRLRHADGTWRYLEGAASGITGPDGDVSMVMVTAHDVTDVRDRDHATTRREQAERDFVTNAAHDLRTPLAAIMSAVEVLQLGAKHVPEERDAFLADLEREAERLSRLMRALLELARVQAAGAVLSREPVEVEPVLVDVAAGLALAPGVVVRVDCTPSLVALADRDVLERAVVNLATNAAKHTSSGRIDFIARSIPGCVVEIDVQDTGNGIDPDHLDRVFDRFYRAGDRRGEDGFGLGLAIVKEAARVLGGSVALESVPGAGTTARLRLPACAGDVS